MTIKQDVYTMLHAFELSCVKSKDHAAQVGQALIDVVQQYVTRTLELHESVFTTREQELLREGKKLDTIRIVRYRLNMTLLDAKRFVEKYGGGLLAQSGKFNEDGQRIYT